MPRLPILAGIAALMMAPFVAAQEPPTPLKPGDNGPAVEILQRTLNARVEPSPALELDGDYGDGTKAAVARFQRSKGLEPTGVADAKTREALGPPPPAAPPVPPPADINAKATAKQSADPPDGAPYVTAKAWAIADGKTGALIEGMDAAKRVEPASTTKVMTARVVLNLAKADPAVLEELVTFSERADRTPGSTAGVKAGEKLSVRELLYGLLLPSGNDGATALAEHFGARVGSGGDSDPLARFVTEMNREAAALNLNETHFENPHGLPAPEHRTSARDLASLAAKALADPTFATIVNTPQRGYTLTTPDGKGRNVAWSNTNRLLQIEGYDGVKTGTTTGAGACLIASGRRDGEHRIVVVLGSGTSDARYADARNLFRWAWRRGRP